MSSIRQRQAVLLAIAAGLTLASVAPGMGGAQETAPPAGAADPASLIARGEEIYGTVCLACHQAGGVGVTDVAVGGYPALAGDPFVTLADPQPVVQTLLTGRAGMPAFRGYSDEEIAGVASYIRQAWGNQAAPVDPALVAEVRAQFTLPAAPDATPIATPYAGSLGTPVAAGTPDAGAAPVETGVPGGAEPAGVTPVPTVGQ